MIPDPLTVFGFVHVMGGDKNGHPTRSQFIDQIPKSAAGSRIHPGSRFIQEEQFGLVHQGNPQAPIAAASRGEGARQRGFVTGQAEPGPGSR